MGVMIVASGATANLSLDWSYSYSTWLFEISDSGSASVQVCIRVLLEVPGLLFFSTYTLLVLFWAEIYHQARSLPTDKLKSTYVCVNVGVYVVQGCIWIYLWVYDNNVQFVGKNIYYCRSVLYYNS